ncbi:MAG: ParA family protein [Gammaproteobacteria bacterium]|nr:MAG: ParA family protein [Gammaproteobacteria bacterium]
MFRTPDQDNLHKIIVLNTKGGCGKTTLATNVASFYALRGPPPTLLDYDPHGFSLRWLDKRPASRPAIHGIAAYELPDQAQGRAHLNMQPDTRTVISDLPANIDLNDLYVHIHAADSILIPVLPSEIDIFSASRFIAELLLDVGLDRRNRRIAIVANRVRKNTRSCQVLMRFLTSLKIPMIAMLRDSQNYVQATAQGIGIFEMPVYKVRKDIGPMNAIVNWLDQWHMRRLDTAIAPGFEHLPGAEVLTPVQQKDPVYRG